jgi:3-hydroxymyristoyl/3-hydroxydecanoyl-(acyl carrier protein) dehydratase
MLLRLLHAGSLENLPFFNGHQLPGMPCLPATIVLRGGGHISPAPW